MLDDLRGHLNQRAEIDALIEVRIHAICDGDANYDDLPEAHWNIVRLKSMRHQRTGRAEPHTGGAGFRDGPLLYSADGWREGKEADLVVTDRAPAAPAIGRGAAHAGRRRAFLVALDDGIARRRHWQRAAELLLAAYDSGDAGAATDALDLALFLDGKLWLGPPSKPDRRC